jgi:KaiC/GvpD/RAD55 family RecA-like ATPase
MRCFKTGVVTIDGQLRGGIPESSVVLVLEDPGAGGDILSYHFTIEGARANESVLYVTTDDPAEYILKYLTEMAGKDAEKIKTNVEFLDFVSGRVFTPAKIKECLKKRYDPFNAFRNILNTKNFDRVVVNNLTYFFLHYSSGDVIQLVEDFSHYAKRDRSVFLLVMTRGMLDSKIETTVKHLADAVMEMTIREAENEVQRRLKFIKLKRAIVPKIILRYDLSDKGIVMESVMRVL